MDNTTEIKQNVRKLMVENLMLQISPEEIGDDPELLGTWTHIRNDEADLFEFLQSRRDAARSDGLDPKGEGGTYDRHRFGLKNPVVIANHVQPPKCELGKFRHAIDSIAARSAAINSSIDSVIPFWSRDGITDSRAIAVAAAIPRVNPISLNSFCLHAVRFS